MSQLTSAPVPPPGPGDHVRGDGPETTIYMDLGCPHCAACWEQLRTLPLRLCFRHFAVPGKHRRAPALHAAAEAAGMQDEGMFWAMIDAIYADHGRQDDPHLWERARALDLDLERFERERRSEAVRARLRRDFESGVRAGVTGTPAAFVAGEKVAHRVLESLRALEPAR